MKRQLGFIWLWFKEITFLKCPDCCEVSNVLISVLKTHLVVLPNPKVYLRVTLNLTKMLYDEFGKIGYILPQTISNTFYFCFTIKYTLFILARVVGGVSID